MLEQDAGVARPATQPGLVGERAEVDDVGQAAGQPRRPPGQEAAYLVLDRDGRVDAAQLVGQVVEVPPSWWASACGVVEVAGGQVLVGHLRSSALIARSRARARSAG